MTEPACGGPFVVLFEGRSGSTYLAEALDSHPSIFSRKERFAEITKRHRDGAAAAIQHRWARWYLSRPPSGGCLAWGFKTKHRDIADPAGFASILREVGARVIWLHRRNRVKLVVSLYNAMRLRDATGDWNLYRSPDRAMEPLVISPADFEEGIRKTEERWRDLQSFVAELGLRTLEVNYESILTAREATLDRVCRFLGVEQRPLRGDALKNTSDDLRLALGNFEQLRSRFLDTRYEAMFDEVLTPGGGEG